MYGPGVALNEIDILTANAAVDFTDQDFDRYGEKPPYGIAGWAADGRSRSAR